MNRMSGPSNGERPFCSCPFSAMSTGTTFSTVFLRCSLDITFPLAAASAACAGVTSRPDASASAAPRRARADSRISEHDSTANASRSSSATEPPASVPPRPGVANKAPGVASMAAVDGAEAMVEAETAGSFTTPSTTPPRMSCTTRADAVKRCSSVMWRSMVR